MKTPHMAEPPKMLLLKYTEHRSQLTRYTPQEQSEMHGQMPWIPYCTFQNQLPWIQRGSISSEARISDNSPSKTCSTDS